ncbi:Rubrerythrin [Desulfamplus magnetovallimortis]|uniref:Rubrerythrin n=1 Tax=Desulfamplus magnetovallimortis TaxID=1246637 RepID=A0A1W1H853_9BACT|nr:rubrerythrin family protein [Desulfamplus magnetovallimortis]SLM28614.1 Rubrerythrin [Desulfamplus magnetovallimortis]
MGKFKESKTAKNLLTAFAAESQASTRYRFFSRRAHDDGFIQIAKIFQETSDQECEHALRFFKFFNGGELEINWKFPAGVIQDTHANLLSSAELEHYIHTEMYPGFSKIALEEGFQRAADTLDAITVAERQHEQLYRELAANLAEKKAFARAETQVWRCLSCGYVHSGKEAPEKCPACVKPTGYFELLGKNW